MNRTQRLEAALRGLLEVCACENRCAPDDMTCATNAARAALADTLPSCCEEVRRAAREEMLTEEFCEDENHLRLARDEWKARAEKAEQARDVSRNRTRELEQTLQGLEATNYGQWRDLAAAQAREWELRATMDGLDEHGWDCPTMRMRSGNGPCDCANARLHAAISAPQGTTALREFGLKVAQNTFSAAEAADGSWTAEAIVDAVLKEK